MGAECELIRATPADHAIEEALRRLTGRSLRRLSSRCDALKARADKATDERYRSLLISYAKAVDGVVQRINSVQRRISPATLDDVIDRLDTLLDSLHGFETDIDDTRADDIAAIIIEHVVTEAEPQVRTLRTLRHICLAYPQDAIRRAGKIGTGRRH